MKESLFNTRIKVLIIAVIAMLATLLTAHYMLKVNNQHFYNPKTAVELVKANVSNFSELYSLTEHLKNTLENIKKSSSAYEKYAQVVEQIHNECQYTFVLEDASTEIEAATEGMKSHNARSKKMCEDIQSLTEYSFLTHDATRPLYKLRTHPKGIFAFLQKPSSPEEIRDNSEAMLQKLKLIPNDLDYEGDEEIKTEIKQLKISASLPLDEFSAHRMADDVSNAQTNLHQHHIYYWNTFARLDDMKKSLGQQISFFCDDAQNLKIVLSQCHK